MGVPAKDTRFLRKLYLILKEEDADVVSWSEDGRAFAILDTARFQRVIKSKYHLSSLCTFRQNLHAHGFSEIEQPAADDIASPSEDSKANVKNPAASPVASDISETYFHPFFVRGYPEFLEKISFDPSVKFRCQECKRQPNDAGTKCTFRKNSFRTTRAEAAIAILANAGAVVSSAAQSFPVRHTAPVAQNSVTTGPPAGRSPLMVHVGGPRHQQQQQQQRETSDAAQKKANPPSATASLAFAGAFLRPSVSSLSSEQSGGQQQASAEQTARASPPAPQSANDKMKPNSGSLMVRLSFGRKDEPRSEGAAHADLMAELAARVAQKSLATTNGKRATISNPVTKKSTSSKPRASRKAASTAASKPAPAMSLKRISPSPSEHDASGDDQRRPESSSAPSQIKIAAFPTPVYSHSNAAFSNVYSQGIPQQPKISSRFSLSTEAASSVPPPSSSAFTPWSSDQGSRSSETFSTGSRFESSNPQVPRHDLLQRGNNGTPSSEQALAVQNFATVKAALSQVQAGLSLPRRQSESGRNDVEQHASSIPVESESVPYEHSARWSRHKISSLTSASVGRDQEGNSEESEPQPRGVPSPQRSSQQVKPTSPVYKNRRFDPTRDEYEEVEQPETRQQPAVKAVEPAVLVIPKRQSMLSGPVMTQLSTSAATKRTTNLSVMPSIQPPMSVTLSIGGRRKPSSSSSRVVSRGDSQTEQESSRKRARVSSPVVSTIRRDVDEGQQTQGANVSGPSAGATEMVDVSADRASVKRPRAAAAASSNAAPPQHKSTPPRGRKLRAKLVAKPKGGEGTDEQAGLSLLVLASSERN
ncbi:Transcription factor skn7 [Globisporangium polare]